MQKEKVEKKKPENFNLKSPFFCYCLVFNMRVLWLYCVFVFSLSVTFYKDSNSGFIAERKEEKLTKNKKYNVFSFCFSLLLLLVCLLVGAGVLALGYGWCVKAVRRCAGGRTEARAWLLEGTERLTQGRGTT